MTGRLTHAIWLATMWGGGSLIWRTKTLMLLVATLSKMPHHPGLVMLYSDCFKTSVKSSSINPSTSLSLIWWRRLQPHVAENVIWDRSALFSLSIRLARTITNLDVESLVMKYVALWNGSSWVGHTTSPSYEVTLASHHQKKRPLHGVGRACRTTLHSKIIRCFQESHWKWGVPKLL